MNNRLDEQYQRLLQDIIDFGTTKNDRTGTGTKSLFGYTIRHNMKNGFPLLTTKKMAWKTMVTELLWFLKGDTNIKFLVDNGCHIWDGDAYKRFLNETIKIEPIDAKQRAIEQLLNSKESKEEFINKIKTDDEFAKKWGSLGPMYGKQWRSWGRKNVTNYDLKDVKGSDQPKVLEAIKNGEDVTKYGVKIEYQNNSIDQIANLINNLKTNPDSRRLMVNAWNVSELDQMVLPPCHYGFQVYTRELSREERIENYNSKFENKIEVPFIKLNLGDAIENTIDMTLSQVNIPTRAISLMWNQRSVDTFLGLPFNIASYGLLLEIIAKEVNMVPDQLIGNLGDVHLYLNHIEQAREQIEREPFALPTLKHLKEDNFYKALSEDQTLYSHLENTDFELVNYQSHPAIKAPLSN
jgi:thymidylate synthase